MKSAPGIAFDYRPSRRIAAIAGVIALLALFAVLKSGLDLSITVFLVVVVPVYAMFALHRFLEPPFVRVARDATGWQLYSRDGDSIAATLRGHVRLGALLVLDFSLPGRRRFHCVLASDAIDDELRRRLLLVLASEPHVKPV